MDKIPTMAIGYDSINDCFHEIVPCDAPQWGIEVTVGNDTVGYSAMVYTTLDRAKAKASLVRKQRPQYTISFRFVGGYKPCSHSDLRLASLDVAVRFPETSIGYLSYERELVIGEMLAKLYTAESDRTVSEFITDMVTYIIAHGCNDGHSRAVKTAIRVLLEDAFHAVIF